MSYRVYNNGLSLQNMPADYVAVAGDVMFDHSPAESEIAAAFSGYAAAAAATALAMQAKTALSATDSTALRCFVAGVEFPAEWKAYVVALRAIANGSATGVTALPVQPAYPAGT